MQTDETRLASTSCRLFPLPVAIRGQLVAPVPHSSFALIFTPAGLPSDKSSSPITLFKGQRGAGRLGHDRRRARRNTRSPHLDPGSMVSASALQFIHLSMRSYAPLNPPEDALRPPYAPYPNSPVSPRLHDPLKHSISRTPAPSLTRTRTRTPPRPNSPLSSQRPAQDRPERRPGPDARRLPGPARRVRPRLPRRDPRLDPAVRLPPRRHPAVPLRRPRPANPLRRGPLVPPPGPLLPPRLRLVARAHPR